MKAKRIMAFTLSIMLIFMMMCTSVNAKRTEDITVTLNVSMYGLPIGEARFVPVQLSGKDTYTLDDVFADAHTLYYDGEDGYQSENGEFGAYITKFWGDESGNFGYQINGGTKYVGGLDTIVEDGDFVDAMIYESSFPDTEAYTKFNTYETEVYEGEELELVLNVAGNDENWDMVFSPCEDAVVIADEAQYVTDSEGKVYLTFDKAGEYVVTARKTKTIKEKEVTAITAPVCKITVKELYQKAINNISEKYSGEEILSDGNMIWFLLDMAVHNALYPENAKTLSEDTKQLCVDKIIDDAVSSEKPNVLAKSILVLRALGYDATDVVDKKLQNHDIVSHLTKLIDEKVQSVTDVYTVPYVLSALSQGESYATSEQIQYLISEIIQNKSSWQDNEWGTDAAAAMLFALAPYYDTNDDVKIAIDETIPLLKAHQTETGAIGNAASTGLAIVAFSNLGFDASEVKNGENSLVDGLMSFLSDDAYGFEPMVNSFSTEQGFRGLLSWQMLKNDMGMMYDFSSYPLETAKATWEPDFCPVDFEVSPYDAEISVSGAEPLENGKYDLCNGTYTYEVSKDGYKTETSSFTVTEEDAQNHISKTIDISLEKKKNNSGASGSSRPEKKEEEPIEEPQEEPKEDKIEMTDYELAFDDVKQDAWYCNAVKFVCQNKIMEGNGKSFDPEGTMTRAMLVTVLHRMDNCPKAEKENTFNDVEKDKWYYDAVSWAETNGIISGVSEGVFAPDDFVSREQMATIIYRYAKSKGMNTEFKENSLVYNDASTISDWAKEALSWANEVGIITGTGEKNILPKDSASRCQTATVIMRFLENGKK